MLNRKVFTKIGTVAYYTSREIIKSKVLVNTVLIGIGLLIVTYIAMSFTYGEPSRVALDFGLGMLTISSVSIAVFMGVSLLSDEMKNRTVYIIISRPVPRFAFVFGKIIGLALILLINILILSTITLSLYFYIGGNFEPLINWTILYITLESLIMLVLVCLFSLITSKVLSVILSIVIYIIGHSIDGVKLLTLVQTNPTLESILDIYHYILPGFYKLNLKQHLLYKQDIAFEYLLSTSIYGIGYCLALVFLTAWIFEKKNLD